MTGKRIIAANSVGCLVLFLLVTLLSQYIYRLFPAGYFLPFHTLMELFGVIISLGIFLISWHAYPQHPDARSLFLGSSLFAVGLLGLFHSLSYPGMPDFLTSSSTTKAISFWIIMKMSFALAFFFSASIKPSFRSGWFKPTLLLIAASLFAFISLAVVTYFPQYMPSWYIEGKGLTAAKIYMEYIISLVFLAAALLYWRIYRQRKEENLPLLISAMFASVMSELSFTLYFSAYDTFNALGHLYQLWAFILVYKAVFLSTIRLPYTKIEHQVAERTHELVEKNQQVALATRHKSEFLARMSHELRTPLNSILGFSELLSEGTYGRLNKKQQQYLGHIVSSGRHLLQLINNILDLSKIEAGRMELVYEDFLLAEALEDARMVIHSLAAKKGITITTESDPSLSQLRADRGKFKQIIYNLLSNAVKFTPEHGRVTISATGHDGWLRLAVADTGIGIKKEDQESLFAEFKQIDSGYGRQHEGTGLGLALTKKLVGIHGGKIWVESAAGQGSTFSFEIPLRSEETYAETGERSKGERENPLILVIEDDPNASQIICHFLRQEGFRVAVAKDGYQGLSMARQLQPAAITLDILLPEKDGWQVLKELKEHPATRSIPVVIISIVDDKKQGLSLGTWEYIVKPVERKTLMKSLRRLSVPADSSSANKKILVVDDDPKLIEMVGAILREEGFQAIGAVGGKEGIRLARAEQPAAIILDLLMPDVSGFDVIEELRKEDPAENIPILILTAHDIKPEEKERLNGRIEGISHKGPFSKEEFLANIREALLPERASNAPG